MKSAGYEDRSCISCNRMGTPWAKPSWPSKHAQWSLLMAIDTCGVGAFYTLRRSTCSGCATVSRVIRQVTLIQYLDKLSTVPDNWDSEEWIVSQTLSFRKTLSGKYDVDVGKKLLIFLSSLGVKKGLGSGEFLNPGWLYYLGRGNERFLYEY